MSLGMRELEIDQPSCMAILDSIINLHASCILNDHTVATFIPPLTYARMHEHWLELLHDTTRGTRMIIVYISEVSDRQQAPYDVTLPFGQAHWPSLSAEREVSGVVTISFNTGSETGDFRGVVQNLFVSPYHRRKGIAKELLAKLESQIYFDRSVWNLMVDTVKGTPAERLFEKLRWKRLGVVKDYGTSPEDGHLLDEVFFWKDTRSEQKVISPT